MLRIAPLLALAALLTSLAGCSSSADLALTDPLPIDGVYRSNGNVGELGRLDLTVRKRVGGIRVFNAELTSDDLEIEASTGRGTLGNLHLVLNFDIGAVDDFYFEGQVQQDSGGAVTGLVGNFIFPNQSEQLPVQFDWVSAPPPLEEE
jgi:hypothetical protein